jgi:hypothetical protein
MVALPTAKIRSARATRRARRCARIAVAALKAAVIIASFTGCWPFNRGPTPQQKFFDQLNRGDTVGANQTWLSMSTEDREKLMRGEGVGAHPSAKAIEAAVQNHKPGDTAPIVVGPDSAVGGWQNLPQLLRATPIPPPGSDTPK